MHKRVLNLLIVFGSFLVMGMLLEMGIRVGSFFSPSDWAAKQTLFIEKLTIPFSYGLVRPNVSIRDLREYFPSGQLQPQPISIQTNRWGMRMREVEIDKSSDTIRIAVMGDSCSFGWMLPEEDAYARVLEGMLNQSGKRRYEVLNFGIPGYTSFHGLLQYRRLVQSFHPDLLILAYGFNDSYEFRFSEKEFYERLKSRHLTEGLKGFSLFLYDHSAFVHWLIGRVRSLDKNAIEANLLQRAKQNQWFPRVDRESYQANLREMILAIRTQAGKAILVNLDLPNTWVCEPIRSLADELQVDRLDIQELFEQNSLPDSRTEVVKQSLQKSGVVATETASNCTVTFRVWVPELTETPNPIFLLLNSSQHSWPWQIPMQDDGTNGDERANDRVWTARLQLEYREMLDYTFLNGKLSNPPPVYENFTKALRFYHHLDMNEMEMGSVWLSPIHTFDRIPFEQLMVPGDVIHPNAVGQRLIAERLMPVVERVMKSRE